MKKRFPKLSLSVLEKVEMVKLMVGGRVDRLYTFANSRRLLFEQEGRHGLSHGFQEMQEKLYEEKALMFKEIDKIFRDKNKPTNQRRLIEVLL